MKKQNAPKTLLEKKQVERKYNLSEQQLEELRNSFSPDYCAEVMIELGHDNDEIIHWTGIGRCRINWMRVKYNAPPNRAELEIFYSGINKDFVAVVSKRERLFSKLFNCGTEHKDFLPLVARVWLSGGS